MPERDQTASSRDPSERQMRSMILEMAPADIAFFKSIIESYDNLATLRTEDPERSHLRLWFAAEAEADINELLAALAPKLPIRIISVA
jgi:hypothetical protein